MAENIKTRKEKWERYARAVDTTTSSKKATFILTARHALDILHGRRSGRMLDIGCGFGEIAILLAQGSDFDIVGCDISSDCVAKTRENVKKAGMQDRIEIQEADIFYLPYPDNYFDIIVSFGYASAATYKGAQGEVARVLKPGGVLFCRLASDIGMENRMRPIDGRRFRLPDGTERFLVDEAMLMQLTRALGGELLDPLKTTIVQDQRCMTTWVVRKPAEGAAG
jgi:cyclopropane fatty-acyl-phospholipid synthase-like methyltransferase